MILIFTTFEGIHTELSFKYKSNSFRITQPVFFQLDSWTVIANQQNGIRIVCV